MWVHRSDFFPNNPFVSPATLSPRSIQRFRSPARSRNRCGINTSSYGFFLPLILSLMIIACSFLRFWIKLIRLLPQIRITFFLTVTNLLSGSVRTASHQQLSLCTPKRKSPLIDTIVHGRKLPWNFFPFKCQYIASLLMLPDKIKSRYIQKRIVCCHNDVKKKHRFQASLPHLLPF